MPAHHGSCVILGQLTKWEEWANSAAFFTAFINSGLPFTLKKITVMFEKHVDFGNTQDSMLIKLFFARVFNTGVMM